MPRTNPLALQIMTSQKDNYSCKPEMFCGGFCRLITQHVAGQHIQGVAQTLQMGPLPAMTAGDGHTEDTHGHIAAALDGGGAVGAVMPEGIHRLVAAQLFRQIDEPGGQLVIEGPLLS